jgi:hypothetical protein
LSLRLDQACGHPTCLLRDGFPSVREQGGPHAQSGRSSVVQQEATRGYGQEGWAIPITNDAGEILDGSCSIANKKDLAEAIKHHPSREKSSLRAHITTRAAALGTL